MVKGCIVRHNVWYVRYYIKLLKSIDRLTIFSGIFQSSLHEIWKAHTAYYVFLYCDTPEGWSTSCLNLENVEVECEQFKINSAINNQEQERMRRGRKRRRNKKQKVTTILLFFTFSDIKNPSNPLQLRNWNFTVSSWNLRNLPYPDQMVVRTRSLSLQQDVERP